MRRRRVRRWFATLVVVAATVGTAACLGLPDLSVVSQDTFIITTGSNFVFTPAVPVGSSASHDFFLAPAGSADDDYVTMIVERNACAEFDLTYLDTNLEVCGSGAPMMPPPPLPKVNCPHQVKFTITFTPVGTAPTSCIYDIYSMKAGGVPNPLVSLTASGSGSLPMYQMSVSPTSNDFLSINTAADSSYVDFAIANSGTQGLTNVTSTLTGANPTKFELTNAAPFMLLPGSGTAHLVGARCHQPSVGTNSAILHVTAMEPAMALDIPLACTGVSTNITATPNPIAFGARIVGDSGDVVVSVMNGGSPDTVAGIGISGPAAADLTLVSPPVTGTPIPGSGSLGLGTVHYSAATPRPLGTLGSLDLTLGSTTVLHYPITGGALSGSIAATPAAIDLGAVCVNSTASASIHVYASSSADVLVTSATTTKPMPFTTDFVMGTVHGNHNGELPFNATFTPRSDGLGEQTTDLTITTDIPNDQGYKLELTGVAVPDGIKTTPDSVDFGSVIQGATTPGHSIVISNCGAGGALQIMSAVIAGTDIDAFKIEVPLTPDLIPQTLNPGESEKFLVVMGPRSAGSQTAELVITHSAGEEHVPLTGFSDSGATTDRETYYGCVVGGSASWPVAAAIALLRRRRRARASNR